MGNIFSGSYATHGITYDYSGIWSRRGGRVEWKAIVRNTEVVSRPQGIIDDELADGDIMRIVKGLIERAIEQGIAAD